MNTVERQAKRDGSEQEGGKYAYMKQAVLIDPHHTFSIKVAAILYGCSYWTLLNPFCKIVKDVQFNTLNQKTIHVAAITKFHLRKTLTSLNIVGYNRKNLDCVCVSIVYTTLSFLVTVLLKIE